LNLSFQSSRSCALANIKLLKDKSLEFANSIGTYVSALYRRLAARRGKRRAILAVAHSIMVSVFHMLSRNEPYRELGANYFDERRRHYTVDRLTSRIEHLGYRVHLEPLPTAAA